MKHAFGRAGARYRLRWLHVGIAGAAAAVLYWLLPFGGEAALLRLVTAAPDGRFAEAIVVPQEWADTSGLLAGAVVRVPLVLAVVNLGGEAAAPERLELSVPTRFHLVRNDGKPLFGRLVAGSPLVRYAVPAALPRVAATGEAMPLAALDTLWLEPVIPSFYCVSMADSVPDFVPAPPAPVEAIARVQIFYSFEGGDLDQRQTGLLTVQLDPELLEREAPDPPPVFPTAYREPAMPRPVLGPLRYGGSRRSFCGEPELPLELLSTLWLTPPGGRFFVIDHGGVPRKYMFDLNRDSIIELEMWDPDGDGDFEAQREARLPIPAFLIPPPEPEQPDLAVLLGGIPRDSLAAYDRYGPILTEPYEPLTAPPDTAPRTDRFRPRILAGIDDDDDDSDDRWRPSRRRVGPRLLGEPTRVPGRREPAGGQPDREPRTGRDADAPQRPAPDRPAAEPAAPARDEPPRRPEPKLLGRPVDSIPPARPDTTSPGR
ncbi:MAG TPA: hypothetical protein VF212_06575 [Longimicrobiales bacterium]